MISRFSSAKGGPVGGARAPAAHGGAAGARPRALHRPQAQQAATAAQMGASGAAEPRQSDEKGAQATEAHAPARLTCGAA